MLQANVTGQYQAVDVVFVLVAVLPWVLLTRSGRRRVGVVKPTRWRWMLPGAIAGAGACVVVFALFSMLWSGTMQNAFAYIGSSCSAVPADASVTDRATYFAIFAVTGMTFSPIGEELLYRGVAQECLRRRLGMTRAALVDAGRSTLTPARSCCDGSAHNSGAGVRDRRCYRPRGGYVRGGAASFWGSVDGDVGELQ